MQDRHPQLDISSVLDINPRSVDKHLEQIFENSASRIAPLRQP